MTSNKAALEQCSIYLMGDLVKIDHEFDGHGLLTAQTE